MPYNPKSKENLISLADRSPEDAYRIRSMGNKKSAETRKKRRLMREVLEDKLELAEIGEELTYQEKATLGLIKGAIEGKAENYKLILEVLGELGNVESNGTPAVSINIIDNSNLEKVMYDEKGKEE